MKQTTGFFIVGILQTVILTRILIRKICNGMRKYYLGDPEEGNDLVKDPKELFKENAENPQLRR